MIGTFENENAARGGADDAELNDELVDITQGASTTEHCERQADRVAHEPR